MAQFLIAFDWLMSSEDSQYECAIVPDSPPGAHAISGINSAKFTEDYERIAALPQSERMAAVSAFYRANFWNDYFGNMLSDDIAKRVFDASVNMGPSTATKLLQKALWPSETPDGVLGPVTVSAVNAANAGQLVNAFRAMRGNYYRAIVKNNPADGKYLAGWLARAEK